jgi:hypothetical protein
VLEFFVSAETGDQLRQYTGDAGIVQELGVCPNFLQRFDRERDIELFIRNLFSG